MKVAALDLGSNSFLCLIAEVECQKITKIYDDQVELVRLGQDVGKTKRFHPEALARADKCLQKFSETIKVHKPQKVLAMATAAAREVTNADEVFALGKKHGIPIEIIPGEKEAAITYKGAVSGLSADNTPRIVIDIGGGSTELIYGIGPELKYGESLNFGGVKLTERFITSQPAAKTEVEALRKFINEESKELVSKLKGHKVTEMIAVAGNPTELAKAEIGKFDPVLIDGYKFTLQKLKEWTQKFQETTAQQRIDKFGITPGRADIIFVGTTILEMMTENLGLNEIKVSTRGVRHGVALEISARGSVNFLKI